MKFTLSKSQWKLIGKKAGWLKTAQSYDYAGLTFNISLHGKHYKDTRTSPEEFPELEIDSVEISDDNELYSYLSEDPEFESKYTNTLGLFTSYNRPIPNVITIEHIGLLITVVVNPQSPGIENSSIDGIKIKNKSEFESSTFVTRISETKEDEMYRAAQEHYESQAADDAYERWRDRQEDDRFNDQ